MNEPMKPKSGPSFRISNRLLAVLLVATAVFMYASIWLKVIKYGF